MVWRGLVQNSGIRKSIKHCLNIHSYPKRIFEHFLNRFAFYSPHRIPADAGAAFALGAIGGSVFHFLKGAKNAPKVRKIHTTNK